MKQKTDDQPAISAVDEHSVESGVVKITNRSRPRRSRRRRIMRLQGLVAWGFAGLAVFGLRRVAPMSTAHAQQPPQQKQVETPTRGGDGSAAPAAAGTLMKAPPSGLDPAATAPRAANDSKAWLAVKDAIAGASGDYQIPAAQPRAPISPETFRQVADLYRQARAESIQGQYFESIRTLEKGLKLDPGSPAMLGLMARNYQTTIGPARALQYYEEVLRYNPDDIEALYRVGSAAWQRREVKKSAACLGRALTILTSPRNDQTLEDADVGPEMELIIRQDLGAVLLNRGYDTAGIAVWQRLIDIMPDSPPLSVRYQGELDRLYRSETSIEMTVGDARMRLRQYAQAQADYQDALDHAPTAQAASGLLTRIVWAQISEGRTSEAITTIAGAIAHPASGAAAGSGVQPGSGKTGALNSEVLSLVGFVAGTPESRQLVDMIRQQLDQHPERLELVQALSVLLPGAQGDKVLSDYLAKNGGDENTAKALLPWFIKQNDLEKTLRFIVSHAVDSHGGADALVSEMIDQTNAAGACVSAWGRLPAAMREAPEAAVVHAELLEADFDWSAARQTLESVIRAHPDFAPARLSMAMLLTRLGLDDEALNAADDLKVEHFRTPDDFYQAASLWSRLGDNDKAWSMLESLGKATDLKGKIDQVEYVNRQAQLQFTRGQKTEAIALWNNAVKDYPDDERAYAALIRVLAPKPGDGTARASDEFVSIVRALYGRMPQSRTFRMLEAQRDAGQGRLDDAITSYKQLISEDPTDVEPMTALLRTLIASNRTDDAAAYFGSLRNTRPGDRQLRRIWLESLVADKQVDAAVAALRTAITDHPSDIDSYTALADVYSAAGRKPDAQDALRQRWMQMPPSITRSLALAQIAAQSNKPDEAQKYLNEARDIAGKLPTHHAASLVLMAYQIAQKSPGPEVWTFVRDVVQEMIVRKDALTPAVSFAMIHAVIELNEPLSDVQKALAVLRDALPESAMDQSTLAVAALASENRLADAKAIADAWLGTDRPFETREANLIDWRLGACARDDEPDRALNIIRRVHESKLDDAVRFVADTSQVVPPARSDKEALANLIYIASEHFSAAGHDASQEKMLEAALKVDPNHAMANNDLAYTWADRNEHLEQAEKMLEISIQAEPSSSAVLDSLGWTRYKLGKFTDSGDDLTQQGAVNLLEQAAAIRKGERTNGMDDPIILDHLGDAYWRARQAEDAVKAWKRGLAAYNQQIDALKQSGDPGSIKLYTDFYQPYATQLNEKVKAAADGKQPPVAYCPALDKNKNADH